MVALRLGSVTFRDFEIPESLPFGGEQALVVHKLPGGARTIDAMGADHKDITWSGRFRAFSAESRAKQLDAYRIGGKPLLLTWGGFRYTVVVRSFDPNYQQPFEIPYSITVTVLEDQSAPAPSFAPGLDEVIGSQLSDLLGLSQPLTLQGVTDGVASVQTAINAVGSLKNASKGGIIGIASAIGAAQVATSGAFNSINATVGGTTSGMPLDIAANLSGQAAAMGQLNQLYQVSTTLGSMGKALR